MVEGSPRVERSGQVMENFARRRERLVSSLSGEELDAYLISSPVNVSYLTG